MNKERVLGESAEPRSALEPAKSNVGRDRAKTLLGCAGRAGAFRAVQHGPHSGSAVAWEWLRLRQVVRYANVSERTIRSWIHAPVDSLPAVRVGGKLLVRRTELDEWLLRHRVKPVGTVDVDAIVKSAMRGAPHGR